MGLALCRGLVRNGTQKVGETGMVATWFPRLVDKDAKSIDMGLMLQRGERLLSFT